MIYPLPRASDLSADGRRRWAVIVRERYLGFTVRRCRSRTWRPATTHDGSIAIGVMLKTLTPVRHRCGDRRERSVGLFDCLAVVVDDAPAPVRMTGGRESQHVHRFPRSSKCIANCIFGLDAHTTRVREIESRIKPDARGVRRLLRLSEARWKALPE